MNDQNICPKHGPSEQLLTKVSLTPDFFYEILLYIEF